MTEQANDRERICNYEFSKYLKVNTLKKGKSGANSHEEICPTLVMSKETLRLS